MDQDKSQGPENQSHSGSGSSGRSTVSGDKVRTHFTWTIEHPRGQCPFCGDKTVLLFAPGMWDADEELAIEAVGEDRYEKEFRDGNENERDK